MTDFNIWTLLPEQSRLKNQRQIERLQESLKKLRQELRDQENAGVDLSKLKDATSISSQNGSRFVRLLSQGLQQRELAAIPSLLLEILCSIKPSYQLLATLVQQGLIGALFCCFQKWSLRAAEREKSMLALEVLQDALYVEKAVQHSDAADWIPALCKALQELGTRLLDCGPQASSGVQVVAPTAEGESSQRMAVVIAETVDILLERCPESRQFLGRDLDISKMIIGFCTLVCHPACLVPLQLMLLQLIFRIFDGKPLEFRSKRWWSSRFNSLSREACETFLLAKYTNLENSLRSLSI